MTYYNDAWEKLENFLEVKIKAVIVRTHARWHEHGKKSNKYFLNLEKRNHIKKHIRKLLINDKNVFIINYTKVIVMVRILLGKRPLF